MLLLVCSLATPGCHEDAHPPTRLLDGRAAKVLPVSLEGVSGTAIETEVHAVTRDRFAHNRAVASCEGFEANGARGPAIVRVGATGRSVTLRVANGHAFLACDGTHPGSVARWCGRAYARLRRGRLPDPRLDLTCTGRSGPIAFGWIEPGRRARYVAVARRGYTEAYEVVASVPVRVASDDVDVERSGATFRVSEHDRHGRLLRRYRVETTVAG